MFDIRKYESLLMVIGPERRRKACYAFAHYLYANALEQEKFGALIGVDELEFVLGNPRFVEDIKMYEFKLTSQSTAVAVLVWAITESLRESQSFGSTFKLKEVYYSIAYLCGDRREAEGILLALMGVTEDDLRLIA